MYCCQALPFRMEFHSLFRMKFHSEWYGKAWQQYIAFYQDALFGQDLPNVLAVCGVCLGNQVFWRMEFHSGWYGKAWHRYIAFYHALMIRFGASCAQLYRSYWIFCVIYDVFEWAWLHWNATSGGFLSTLFLLLWDPAVWDRWVITTQYRCPAGRVTW